MEFYVRLIFAVKKIRVSHSAQKIEKNMQQQLTKGCLPKSDFTSEIGAQCHHFSLLYELPAQCASAHNLHKYTKSSDVSIMSNGTMDLNQQEK